MSKKSFLHTYRDLYSDVVNQVLLMNLVARQIWREDERARECFKKINDAVIALSSKESLIGKIGENAFKEFFGNISDEGDYEFFDKLEKTCQEREEFGTYVDRGLLNFSNPISAAIENEPVFKHRVIFNILKDVFKILDKKQRLSSSNNNLKSWYRDFLITLFGEVGCIKNTYGYNYQNLYMCLYHFDLVYENFIVDYSKKSKKDGSEAEGKNEKDNLSDDQKREMLQEVATWIRRTTRTYKSNFSRNTKIFHNAYLGKLNGNPNPDASSLAIHFIDEKPVKLIAEGSLEDLSSYSDEICKYLKIWLCDQWLAKHQSMTYDKALLRKECDEYRNYMKNKEIEGIKNQAKMFTKIESISTLCYAILAWDLCEGIRADKITQDDAVGVIEKKYHKIANRTFPTEGVKRQLGVIGSRIENKYYSQGKTKQDAVLQQQQFMADREFFPYPLFTCRD